MKKILSKSLIFIGLPKCGSTSLNDFAKRYVSSEHELWHSGLTDVIVKRQHGLVDSTYLADYYLLRSFSSNLQVDSSTFNHFCFDFLPSIFPSSTFLCVTREPLSWVCSMINMWCYFGRIHQFAISYPSDYDLRDIRKWSSWLNKYGNLYSSSLNTHKISFALSSGQHDYLMSLGLDLLRFWIEYMYRVFSFAKSSPVFFYDFDTTDRLISFFINFFELDPGSLDYSFPLSNSQRFIPPRSLNQNSVLEPITPIHFDAISNHTLHLKAREIFDMLPATLSS